MRVLLDTCVWHGVRDALTAAGHDVVWAGDWPEDPGDDAIMATAYHEARVLVTLDKDFGDLAFVGLRPHAGIVRLVNITARRQPDLCVLLLDTYERQLAARALVVAEQHRVRVRLPGRGER